MKNHYTKVPQWFFDIAPKLKPSELRCLIAILRQTKGWNRESDYLSWTQLMDMTGLSTQGVASGLAGLKLKEIIDADGATIRGQRITITPQNSEIIASISITTQNEPDLTLLNHDSTLLINLKVESDREKVESQRTTVNNTIKDNNNNGKFTPDQEESLTLLLSVGLDSETANRLIHTAWENGRDISYIQTITGYVALNSKINPAGLARYMIERNIVQEVTSKAYEKPVKAARVPALDKYSHGGKEHKLAESTCIICHPELLEASYEEI